MIYIGKHKTDNINDSYMGSGLRIKRAIEKYGIDNFEKTILFECSSEEEMNQKEAEIVNEDFISRDDVYNIVVGGEGSWEHVNKTCHNNRHNHRKTGWLQKDEHGLNASQRTIASYTPEQYKEHIEKISAGIKRYYEQNGSHWTGKKHSPETIKKISEKAKLHVGDKNSQYGTMWICNHELRINKKIHKSDPIPNGWLPGRICK